MLVFIIDARKALKEKNLEEADVSCKYYTSYVLFTVKSFLEV